MGANSLPQETEYPYSDRQPIRPALLLTEEVREYAAQLGMEEEKALAAGLKEKAEEFLKTGAEIYV